jgi:hypothetical protein
LVVPDLNLIKQVKQAVTFRNTEKNEGGVGFPPKGGWQRREHTSHPLPDIAAGGGRTRGLERRVEAD